MRFGCKNLCTSNLTRSLRNSISKNNFFIHEYGKLSIHAAQTMLLSQHLVVLFEQEIYNNFTAKMI
jgi:hypothetical protein